MPTALLVLIVLAVAIAAYVLLTRKDKKDSPKPTATITHLPPRQIPTAPVKQKQAPPAATRRLAAPTSPIRTAQGVTYYPAGNNIYRNSEDDSVMTWLMLYLLLSSNDQNKYETPASYVEGMSLAEAEAETGYLIVDHELRQSAQDHGPIASAAAPSDSPSVPDSDTSHKNDFDTSPSTHPSSDSSSSSSYDSGSSSSSSSSSYDSGSNSSYDSGSSSSFDSGSSF